MKIAICNETYRDWSFEAAFQNASENGYDGIEIAPFTLHKNAFDITDQQIEETVQLADQHQLEIIGLHWLLAFTEGLHLTSRDDAVRKATAEYLRRLAVVCHALGGSVMVLGSPAQRNLGDGMSVEEGNQLAVDCLSQVVDLLEDLNVTLALEPLGPEEGNFIQTAAWGRQLIHRIGSPKVGLHLDVKAMSTESESFEDIIIASANELVHFHVNDPNRRGPGMGEVDFQPILKALKSIRYCGWLSVEVFDETVPPETTARESIQYLTQILHQD